MGDLNLQIRWLLQRKGTAGKQGWTQIAQWCDCYSSQERECWPGPGHWIQTDKQLEVETEWTGPDRFDTGGERKQEGRVNGRLLVWITGHMVRLFTEKRKTKQGQVKKSKLCVGYWILKCLLKGHMEMPGRQVNTRKL